jgi:hypothetical protein
VAYDAAFGGIGEFDAKGEVEGTVEGLDPGDGGIVALDCSAAFCEHAVSKAHVHVRTIAPKTLPRMALNGTMPSDAKLRSPAAEHESTP